MTSAHTATHCNWCSLLQSVAVSGSLSHSVAVCCSLLQSVAVCCSMLHDVAVCCSFYRIIDHVQMRMEREVSEWVRERKPKSGWWGGIGGGRSEMKHSHSNVAAILDFTIWVSLFLPPLNSPSPSPVPFLFFSATLRNQRRCHPTPIITAILDYTIWVFFLLPPLFSLSPSPISLVFFSATLQKQRWCRPYTNVTAFLDLAI